MKKLIVCGCSFSAVSHKEELKTSWSELLANKLGWELKNVARQGCSNGGIRIQIDEVIRQRPDFAIITPTSYDRVEIPNFTKEKLKISDFSYYNKIIEALLQPSIFAKTDDNKKSYDKNAGLDNINYGKNHSRMILETLHSLSGNWTHPYRPNQPVPEEVQKALQLYITNLYDGMWKKQIDEWIMRDGLVQLHANNIPFLINPGYLLWESISDMKETLHNVIPEKYMLDNEEFNPYTVFRAHPPEGATPENPYGPNDPGYHTNQYGQELIANGFYDIIKGRWGL
jgi:hypothetical protein